MSLGTTATRTGVPLPTNAYGVYEVPMKCAVRSTAPCPDSTEHELVCLEAYMGSVMVMVWVRLHVGLVELLWRDYRAVSHDNPWKKLELVFRALPVDGRLDLIEVEAFRDGRWISIIPPN